ncbi:uncharacterized protein LOC134107073 isoform X2 [Pungitius pungitius]|uniref:uncharacterized protein LOC134107073 isoform X2 n=1 Tax=Pungitius pungitius TaxID=134920 RepID=UPI002E11372C
MAALPLSTQSGPHSLLGLGSQHGKEQTGHKDPDYLKSMLNYVLEHRDETVILKNPAGAILTIGDLNDTIYRDKKIVVNGWNKFYLPDIVSMKVLGVVKGTSCPEDHLVLMTCEDQKVYAYDGEELHLVASSWEQLLGEGFQYPADKSYYKGEAFKDTDWDEVRKGEVGRRLDQEHLKLVTSKMSKLLKNLRSIETVFSPGACK